MPNEHRPLKVFLSYASQDRSIVRELSRRLVSEGWIDTWLDEKSLLPGQDWRLKIEEAVEDSDIVIICLSSNSVTKEGYVQKELRYAREIALEKPEETIFLIPLRLDECDVPRGLRFYQWVDYFGEKKEETYSALIESLKLRHKQKLVLEERERIRKEKLEREHPQNIASERSKREAAEKIACEEPETEATEKPRSKPAEAGSGRNNSQAEPKAIKVQTAQQNSSTQFALWVIGSITVILLISMLAFNNGNKPLISIPTFTHISSPTKTPDDSVNPTKSFTSTPTISVTDTTGLILTELPTELTDTKNVRMELVSVSGSDFYMDKYEVTNELYGICVESEACEPPTNSGYLNEVEYSNHPVVYVDYDRAKSYCEWRGARLPTLEEWKISSEGFPWGVARGCTYGNYATRVISAGRYEFCVGSTVPVGSYEQGKSIFNVYDLIGNVAEWANGTYDGDYYRVVGNSWKNLNSFFADLNYDNVSNKVATNTIGFRCAKDVSK